MQGSTIFSIYTHFVCKKTSLILILVDVWYVLLFLIIWWLWYLCCFFHIRLNEHIFLCCGSQQVQHYTNQLAKETNRHLKELGCLPPSLSPSEQVNNAFTVHISPFTFPLLNTCSQNKVLTQHSVDARVGKHHLICWVICILCQTSEMHCEHCEHDLYKMKYCGLYRLLYTDHVHRHPALCFTATAEDPKGPADERLLCCPQQLPGGAASCCWEGERVRGQGTCRNPPHCKSCQQHQPQSALPQRAWDACHSHQSWENWDLSHTQPFGHSPC